MRRCGIQQDASSKKLALQQRSGLERRLSSGSFGRPPVLRSSAPSEAS